MVKNISSYNRSNIVIGKKWSVEKLKFADFKQVMKSLFSKRTNKATQL
jgi:hypothetical protein